MLTLTGKEECLEVVACGKESKVTRAGSSKNVTTRQHMASSPVQQRNTIHL